MFNISDFLQQPCPSCSGVNCVCDTMVVSGGYQYVVVGWAECTCNIREAERKYITKKYYDLDTISDLDVIFSVMEDSKKLSANLLKEKALEVANHLKQYEILIQHNKNTKTIYIPRITSLQLEEFANSSIQQNDAETLEYMYSDIAHLWGVIQNNNQLKPNNNQLKLDNIKVENYPKLSNTQVLSNDKEEITKLEKDTLPYMIKLEQAQISIINLLTATDTVLIPFIESFKFIESLSYSIV